MNTGIVHIRVVSTHAEFDKINAVFVCPYFPYQRTSPEGAPHLATDIETEKPVPPICLSLFPRLCLSLFPRLEWNAKVSELG